MKEIYRLALIFIIALFSGLGLMTNPLFAWDDPILITNDSRYTFEKPQVKFDANGVAYVAYTALTVGSSSANIFLSRFDGESVSFVKNVSETSHHAYEGDIGISATGQIHVAWAEYSQNNPNTQTIRYRSASGTSWSSIQTLGTMTSTDLVEDLRLAVDANNNVFIVFMVWPASRCKLVSKYASTVNVQDFPVLGRAKHPDVAVDSRYIYTAWQHMVGDSYTIYTQRKNNSVSGSWLAAIDLRVSNAQKPRIDVDGLNNPHIVYWRKDSVSSRMLFHRFWQGNAFSPAQVISDPGDYLTYHYADFELKGAQMIATMQLGGYLGGRALYYNWGENGDWGGIHVVPGTTSMSPTRASVDLTSSGEAAIAVAAEDKAVYLIPSEGDFTEPEPVPNVPPSAMFTFNPSGGLYPLNVTFNASSSKDSDGQIVGYAWEFGDGGKGSGVVAQHVFQAAKRYIIRLTVTDDRGDTGTATGEIEVFGLHPPLNVQFARHENRNLFSREYLYRITWNPNPKNEEVGAKIVSYKIYRREKGSSYNYGHFFTVAAGNHSEYEYLDRSLGGSTQQYEYKISSLDGAGRESELN